MTQSILDFGNMKAVRDGGHVTISALSDPPRLSLMEARVLSIWLIKEVEMTVFAQEIPAPGRPVHLRLADGTCICPTCRPKLWRYADKPGEQL